MRVDVLGPVAVRGDDEHELPLGGPRQRAVLAVLALYGGEVVDADLLVDAVWDGTPPRTAAHTLQNYVLRLRRLGLAITRAGDGYRLDTPTDVALLTSLRERGGVQALREAAALVRGRPGAEVADRVPARVAALAELVALVDEEAASAMLEEASDSASAAALVPWLRGLVDSAPLRERRWELLILGLYRAGRQAEALEAFAEVRALLADELGIDPGVALRTMQQAVLAQDARLTPARRTAITVGGRAVPGLATRLVGRESVRAELAAAASRLVTITGPLGAGKTRLAVAYAQDLAGPIWFVPLEGLPDHVGVAQAVLDAVAPAGTARDAQEGVRAALGDAEGTLVLDGAEQRLGEVRALTTDLLRTCPGIRLLVTSRQVLGHHDEATVRVGGLTAIEARELLRDRARLTDPAFELDDADLAAADRLCALVDGLPLGIELVARHLRLLGVDDLADRVDADLEHWTAGAVESGGGLVGAVAVAVDGLTDRERGLLLRLSVLVAEADLALVRDVGAPDHDESWTYGVLAALVDRSLVQVRTGPDGVRYALLLSVRQHCLARMPDDEREAAARAYHHAVLRRCARSADALQSPARARTLRALDADAAHLRAALSASLDGATGLDALPTATALTDYWLARRPAEGMTWLARLLALDPPGGAGRAETLLQMGHLAYWLTDFDLGRRLLQEARELVDPGQNPLLYGRILRRLGAISAARDDVEDAGRLLRESADRLEAAGAEDEEAVTLLHLGTLLADQGRTDEALPVLLRTRDALARLGDPLREALAVSALALVWWRRGDLDAALGAGQDALTRFRALGQRPPEGVAAYRQAAVARAAGMPEVARAHALDALTVGETTGTRTTSALAHERLARLDLDAGDRASATAHLRAALDGIDPDADRWVLAELVETVARLQHSVGRPAGALLAAAVELRAQIGQPLAPYERDELARLAEPVTGSSPVDPPALRAYALALIGAEPVAAVAPARP